MSAEDCLSLLEKEEWESRAACKGMDPNVFFPDVLETIEEDRAIAKRVCANCPVRQQCEDKGWHEEYGIWGGIDEDERWLAHGGEDGDMVSRSRLRGFWNDG